MARMRSQEGLKGWEGKEGGSRAWHLEKIKEPVWGEFWNDEREGLESGTLRVEIAGVGQ